MNSNYLMMVGILSTLLPLASVAADKLKTVPTVAQKLVATQSVALTKQTSVAKPVNTVESATVSPKTWWEKELESGKPFSERLLKSVPGFPTWFACSLFLTDTPD